MTEIDALKYELEENRKSFDTLHKKYVELLKQQGRLEKENEQLKFKKDRYKRLSEIRQESINNRILTIKEFIDNCSDKKVKKTLEQLFHSEVKEYDLSKKIRKLEKENEQLKKELDQFYLLIGRGDWSGLIDKLILHYTRKKKEF